MLSERRKPDSKSTAQAETFAKEIVSDKETFGHHGGSTSIEGHVLEGADFEAEVFSSDYESESGHAGNRSRRVSNSSVSDSRLQCEKSVVDSEKVQYPWTGEGYSKNPDRKMTFFCVVLGTRGDVQPLIMISKRLLRDGHRVRLACHEAHRDSIEGQGVSWYPLEGWPPEELIAAPLDGRLTSIVPLVKSRNKYYGWYRSLYQSCKVALDAPWDDGTNFEVDGIIAAHQVFCALDLAEFKRIPLFVYAAFPILPTKEFRHPFGIVMEGHVHGNKFSNSASFALQEAAYEIGLHSMQSECRKFLHLPSLRSGSRTMSGRRLAKLRIPFFGLWSPHLLRNPSNYHENHVITGWVEQSGGLGTDVLPSDLLAYLRDDDDKPIFFGYTKT